VAEAPYKKKKKEKKEKKKKKNNNNNTKRRRRLKILSNILQLLATKDGTVTGIRLFKV